MSQKSGIQQIQRNLRTLYQTDRHHIFGGEVGVEDRQSG